VKEETTTARAGMLMPRESVSVAKTTLIRPWVKSSSTSSLWKGRSPAPAEHAAVDHLVVEGHLARVLEAPEPVRRDLIDRLLLGIRGQVEGVVGAALEGLPAAAAGEDEVDRRQHPLLLQLGDHVEQVVGGKGSEAVDAVGRLLLGRGLGPGLLVDSAVRSEERVKAVLDR